MMTCFYQASSVLQIVLLVISQFAVISLAAGFILLFKRRCKLPKMIGMGAVLLLNTTLYILMQLDSRITGAEQGLHLHVPYAVLMLVTLLSIGLGAWIALSETQNRKTINHRSIKESFDNLPTGVCFFNEAGLPVLCNHAMQRFSFAVCNRDVQFVTDLEDCLDKDFVPIGDVEREGSVFILPDGQVIRLKMKLLTYENGETYTQFTATDITQLYQSRAELSRENEQLRKVQSNLMQMSANMVAVTREEEILSAKMRIHDDMGRCLMAAQQYLKKCDPVDISDHMIASWHRAVSMLKNYNESEEEDMLAQIRKTCEFFKLKLVRTGELPAQEKVAYLLTCALRECLTNAVRYASATELYADFTETATEATVTITNNGAVPDRKIVEGGGLSTLRCRVERAGGQMIVQSHPCFRLQVTLPKTKEDAL